MGIQGEKLRKDTASLGKYILSDKLMVGVRLKITIYHFEKFTIYHILSSSVKSWNSAQTFLPDGHTDWHYSPSGNLPAL